MPCPRAHRLRAACASRCHDPACCGGLDRGQGRGPATQPRSRGGEGVKTNLLFFTRGRATERIWCYDLSQIKVGKKTPLTLANFEECFRLLPDRADSERSWTVTRRDIEAKGYDLKAVNPSARSQEDRRTQDELLDLIEAKGREVAEAIAALRAPRKDSA